MRKSFVAGNWKMNTTLADGKALIEKLKSELSGVTGVDVAVCPPFVYVPQAVQAVAGSDIKVGAQNCYFEKSGAYTGETAPEMLKDVGCTYVILGHSERRHILKETDEVINKKVKKALDAGIEVILCVGELLEEREAGNTESVVETQMAGGLKDITAGQMGHITIAYEPVWAIGTGKTASPDQAQDVHAFIRAWMTNAFGEAVSEAVRIQYGGSVKSDNANELLGQKDIDGALVGGAALKADSFAAIVKAGVA
jgi:triosephosphate isomerase